MARYELAERIGLGGMAEIFRGVATAGGGFEKPVAIKRILPHLSQDKRFVEALITEAKTLSRLRHRNVVQIYDVGLGDDGQYFLVMEYVDGLDLGRMYEALEKRSRRLPLDVALYITGEVCEALEHAHNARGEDGRPLGLVHRDVSPSNVLLSRSGEVKLTDFGIAKRAEEATGHGGVRGKFAYISPEQAHNRRVDARSDVYSVGILLFELVTGHRLFSDLPDFDALRAVREGRLPRPRDIDPSLDAELERILLTGLAPRPEDRFPTAGTLGAQLRTCRYSMVSSVADPAVEIARLVEEHAGRKEDKSPAREPSVVRISTVAGFSGSFEVPNELSGRSISGELTTVPPALGLEEEEDTRAVNLPAGSHPLLAQPPATRDLEQLVARDRRERAARGEPDIADAETRVLDYRPMDLFPELGAASDAAPAVEAVSHAESPGPHESIAEAADPARSRSITPTIRQVFYTGALLEDPREPSPPAPAVPILDGRVMASRRRSVLLAVGAALGLAVLSFVIAGAFMSGSGTAQVSRAPDAAPPPPPIDAAPLPAPAPTPTPPPEPEPTPAQPPSTSEGKTATRPAAERPKRRRKKQPRKRSAERSGEKRRSSGSGRR